ncbi:hypothetical protein [Streptomyces sp. NPDC048295]|uniref:hypothetical protein n=1 Tax=Streptomyces sp. NPDC048295 TaxID=3154617 RepID=UPI00343D1E11
MNILLVEEAPAVVHYPKGTVDPAVPAVGKAGGMDVLRAAESDGCNDRSSRKTAEES